MSTRRDFLALTAGAIVARTVLPLAARAEPQTNQDARAELETMATWDDATARMLVWWDSASRHERFCFVLMLKRVDGGMSMAEAGVLFRHDLADPSRAVSL